MTNGIEAGFIVVFGPEYGPIEYRKWLKMKEDGEHGKEDSYCEYGEACQAET